MNKVIFTFVISIIILLMSLFFLSRDTYYYLRRFWLGGKATHANLIVFGKARSGLEPRSTVLDWSRLPSHNRCRCSKRESVSCSIRSTRRAGNRIERQYNTIIMKLECKNTVATDVIDSEYIKEDTWFVFSNTLQFGFEWKKKDKVLFFIIK